MKRPALPADLSFSQAHIRMGTVLLLLATCLLQLSCRQTSSQSWHIQLFPLAQNQHAKLNGETVMWQTEQDMLSELKVQRPRHITIAAYSEAVAAEWYNLIRSLAIAREPYGFTLTITAAGRPITAPQEPETNDARRSAWTR